MSRASVLIVPGLLAAATLSLAACGGDSSSADAKPCSSDATSPGSSLSVTAIDYGFEPDALEAKAGDIAFSYEQGGVQPHTFVIEGCNDFKLSVAGSGSSDEGVVKLEAGTYTVYCDVPGHRAKGMEAELEVS